MRDIREFHTNFYSNQTRILQDAFLLKFMSVKKPIRSRSVKENSSRKGVTTQYFVKQFDTRDFQLQVCKAAFMGILDVSKDRLKKIAKDHLLTGQLPKENRGGDRKSAKYGNRRRSVKEFIQKLRGVESHYCRSKNIERQYLSSELNIAKLFKMYNESVDDRLKVKKTFFREIFLRCFNIGFGTPATDACSKCIELSEKIKIEKVEENKIKLMTEKRVHKLRSNAFFSKLREEKTELLTLSFDCQKNLPNPKIPDQLAYYSRQLYTYNFTVVKGSSKSKLTAENVFIYTWMENEFSKGSNQICSAVFDCLSNTDLLDYSSIRFCADGCGGQNRNTTMIAMCCHFLKNIAPANIKEIELVFPVPGHSFLPSDRVFGRIEKILKKEVTIVSPTRYVDIFKEHGTVKRLGHECTVLDFKSEAGQYFKNVASWHFKFSEAKRFIITKKSANNILVRGETFYNSDTGASEPILKRGKKLSNFCPTAIQNGIPVKPEKLVDVKKLLTKHFGDEWVNREELSFYKNLLDIGIDVVDEDVPQDGDAVDSADYCEENAGETAEPRV